MDVKRKKPQQKNTRQAAIKRRRKRRLRKYTLYYLAFIVFAVAAGIALSLTVFFQITAITVSGNTKYAEGDIIATSRIEMGENLFRADTSAASAAIEAAYPYIEHARVRRSFPATVVIEVEQAKPDAALRYHLGYMLITAEGRVLDIALTDLPEGFVQVVGIDPGDTQPGDYLPENCAEQLVMLSYLREALGEVPFEGLNLIDLTDRLDIRLLYENRLIIHLGSEGDLPRKLTYAQVIIGEKTDHNFMGVLNAAEGPATLRYRNIFAPENWPFGEELLSLYSRTATVAGAETEETPEATGETETAPAPDETGGTAPSSGAGEEAMPEPGTYTINGEPVDMYGNPLP